MCGKWLLRNLCSSHIRIHVEIMFHVNGKQYRQKTKLGQGMFGKCWLVADNSTGAQYAVKTVDMRKLDAYQRNQAKAEVDILRASEHNSSGAGHPNIVRYYNNWFRGDELCLLMEYCPNGNLEQYIDGCKTEGMPIPEMEVSYKLWQLLSALDYCHNTMHVIHRDIKPANILLDRTGRVKLADFGISKQVQDMAMLAQTQAGTPMYMPPEMMRGMQYGPKVDIWMLGCVLYEIMAYKLPWCVGHEVRSWNELQRRVLSQPIDTAFLRKRGYSSDVCKVAHCMLDRDEKARPNTQNLLQLCTMHAPPSSATCDLYQTITPSTRTPFTNARSYSTPTLPVVESEEEHGYAHNYPPPPSAVDIGDEMPPMDDLSIDAPPLPHEYIPQPVPRDSRPPSPRLPPSPMAKPATPRTLFDKGDGTERGRPRRIMPRRPAAPTYAPRDAAVAIQTAMRQSLTRRRPASKPHLPPLAPAPAAARRGYQEIHNRAAAPHDPYAGAAGVRARRVDQVAPRVFKNEAALPPAPISARRQPAGNRKAWL